MERFINKGYQIIIDPSLRNEESHVAIDKRGEGQKKYFPKRTPDDIEWLHRYGEVVQRSITDLFTILSPSEKK